MVKDAKGNVVEGDTTPLDISIDGIPRTDVTDLDKFNVVVVYETTPAVEDGTDANGNIKYETADWTRGVTTAQTGGQNS